MASAICDRAVFNLSNNRGIFPIETDLMTAIDAPWTAYFKRLTRFARKSWLVALLDQAVVSGTSLGTTVLVGRYCGSDALGLFGLAFSVLVLSNGIQASLVTTPYTIFRLRFGGLVNPKIHAGAALLGCVLLILASCFVAFSLATFFTVTNQSASVRAMAWSMGIAIPGYLAREFARKFDFASLNMLSPLILDTAIAGLQIGMLLALGVSGNLDSGFALCIIGLTSGLVVVFWSIRRRSSFTWEARHTVHRIRHDWRFGRWLLVQHVINVCQMYAMFWLLSFLMDTTATGILTACAAIANLANPLLQGIGNFLSPRFANVVARRSRAETIQLYIRTTVALGVAVSCFTAFAAFFGQELLDVFYDDPTYDGFGIVVTLLAIRLLFVAPTLAAESANVAMEYPRGNAIATLVGLTITLATAFPLVLNYGVTGAATAMMLGTGAESIFMVSIFVYVSRVLNWETGTPHKP